MQTRAMVRLGANACILGRNASKTEAAAKDIATARPGAKVIGIGECDVRKVNWICLLDRKRDVQPVADDSPDDRLRASKLRPRDASRSLEALTL